MLADRVKETTTTTGTGTLSLDGAVSGFQTFVAGIGTGLSCYYAIVHRSAAEWEVGRGTVTDGSPDTLSRTEFHSGSSASFVDFSAGTKDVFVAFPADVGMPRSQNLLLNPCFESVLPGTHTSALKSVTWEDGASAKGSQFPGWYGYVTKAGDTFNVDVSTGTYSSSGKQAAQIWGVLIDSPSTPLVFEQVWNGAEGLADLVASCRGGYLAFALDVRMAVATANAIRIGIDKNAEASYTYSSYAAATNVWQRLFVSIPASGALTEFRFRVEIPGSGGVGYLLDCGMVAWSPGPLVSLPYVARPQISRRLNAYTGASVLGDEASGGALDCPCNDAALSTPWELNTVRPRWATHFTGMAGVAGEDAMVNISVGGHHIGSYISGLGYIYGDLGPIPIRDDGLVRVTNSSEQENFYYVLEDWIGEGL